MFHYTRTHSSIQRFAGAKAQPQAGRDADEHFEARRKSANDHRLHLRRPHRTNGLRSQQHLRDDVTAATRRRIHAAKRGCNASAVRVDCAAGARA